MFERANTRQRIFTEAATAGSPDKEVVPVSREREIDQIVEALHPAIYRNSAEAVMVCGKPGTGKTTCVKHILEKIDEETRVKPVYINCWQYNTRPSLLSHLLIQLGYPAPRKGKPIDELLSIIREWITKNRSIVVALDEFDQLRDPAEIVYDLYQLNQVAENTLCLILISNTLPRELSLDPRSDSRLSYRAIEFSPYDRHALQAILSDHADRIFRPGSVSEYALQVIAARVADAEGDSRRAINLLCRAGQIAEQEGSDEISADHADRACTD